ncbi:MAG: MATE family efflux transporter [Muribaculum sp.]|nr:MATE family efflux transporter [Muribaculaceae bacterium]MCM1081316.1 MATE family efflux transporter [Muribaculum sp.]
MTKYRQEYAKIVKLGLPILVGQLGMIVVAFADNIMVGRYSTDALASASFVNNVFNVAIFACLGFTYGLTPLIGALFSRDRFDKIGAMIRNGLFANMLFALLITALMTLLYLNLDSLGQPDELMPLIKPYFVLSLIGILPVAIFNALSQWLYAINRTGIPMWIVLVANVVNIAGNYLLIFGHCGFPELGLMGAGYSTLISRIICPLAAMYVLLCMRRFRVYRDGFVNSRINKTLLSHINRTSWPVSVQMTLESVCFSFSAVMAGWIGAVPLAAYQIIVITGTLGFCVYYSMASAVSVIVANNAGLNDSRAMRHTAFAGYHIVLVLATLSSLVFIFFERYLILLFTEDIRVIELTMTLIFPLVLYQYADATQILFANALRGTSNVMPMLWIAFVSYMVVGIPAGYIITFPCGMATYGIILSFSISLIIAASLFLYFFLRTTSRHEFG